MYEQKSHNPNHSLFLHEKTHPLWGWHYINTPVYDNWGATRINTHTRFSCTRSIKNALTPTIIYTLSLSSVAGTRAYTKTLHASRMRKPHTHTHTHTHGRRFTNMITH